MRLQGRASCGNRTEPCNHNRRNQKSPSFFKYSVKRICSSNPFRISKNPFSDRVIHHAIMNVLEPVFERQFVFHTYACRKGKGTHAVLKQLLCRIIKDVRCQGVLIMENLFLLFSIPAFLKYIEKFNYLIHNYKNKFLRGLL